MRWTSIIGVLLGMLALGAGCGSGPQVDPDLAAKLVVQAASEVDDGFGALSLNELADLAGLPALLPAEAARTLAEAWPHLPGEDASTEDRVAFAAEVAEVVAAVPDLRADLEALALALLDNVQEARVQGRPGAMLAVGGRRSVEAALARTFRASVAQDPLRKAAVVRWVNERNGWRLVDGEFVDPGVVAVPPLPLIPLDVPDDEWISGVGASGEPLPMALLDAQFSVALIDFVPVVVTAVDD